MSLLPEPLRALIAAEADAPPPPVVRAFAEDFAARPGVAAVLFYGNMMRDAEASGLLDLYVLTDRARDWSGPGLAAAAGRLLPPNVYHERRGETAAKVAVLTLGAFGRRMRRGSWDTTLWARFAQPVRLVHARDAATRAAVLEALETAAETAAWWASRLAEAGEAEEVWRDLFRATYGAELRVEAPGRAQNIIAASPERYRLLHEALIAPASPDGAERTGARRAWMLRRRAGKALNLARLVKAAFTFRGGLPYIISKIERHGGRPLELRPWERRLPWLAAPLVMLRLLREKRLR